MTVFRTPFIRLTLQLTLTLLIAAIFTTTLLVLVFTPPYPASASDLPTIHAARQADYRTDHDPIPFAPLDPRAIDSILP
ncbi:MAG: hypothetical protein AB1457_07465 [Chloroflexota bacterium]